MSIAWANSVGISNVVLPSKSISLHPPSRSKSSTPSCSIVVDVSMAARGVAVAFASTAWASGRK